MSRKGKERAADAPEQADALQQVASQAGIPQEDTAKALFSLMSFLSKDAENGNPASSPSAAAGSPEASSSMGVGQSSNVMDLMQSLARFTDADKRARPSSHVYHPQPTRSGRVPAPIQSAATEAVFDLEKYIDFPSDSDSDDEDFLPQLADAQNNKHGPKTRSKDGLALRSSEADDIEEDDEFVPESDNTMSGDEEIVMAYNLVAPATPSLNQFAFGDAFPNFDMPPDDFPIDFGFGSPTDLSNISGILELQSPAALQSADINSLLSEPTSNPFKRSAQTRPIEKDAASEIPQTPIDIPITPASPDIQMAEVEKTPTLAAPVKRGRGRPRKNPLPDPLQPAKPAPPVAVVPIPAETEDKPKTKRKIIPPELRKEARMERNRRLAKENAERKKRNLAEAQNVAARTTADNDLLAAENAQLREQIQGLQTQLSRLQQQLSLIQAHSTARPLQSRQALVNGDDQRTANAGTYLDELVQSWSGR